MFSMKLIAIIGNISSGKTSCVERLTDDYQTKQCTLPLNIVPVYECVERFTQYKTDFDPLALMYADPIKNAAIVQAYIIQSINQHLTSVIKNVPEKEHKNTLLICDRSLFSPLIFCKVHHMRGTFTDFVYTYLCEETCRLAEQTLVKHNLKYDGIFYIHSPIEKCIDRLRKRARICEVNNLSEDYLACVENSYINHLDWWRERCGSENVATVQSEDDISTMSEQLASFIRYRWNK